MLTLPLHPAVVHLPLALAGVVPLVFVGLLWAIRTGRLPPRVWMVGVLLQAVLLLGVVVALTTGGAEEERVERTIAEARIEAHARAAQAFGAASVAVLVGALAALAVRKHRGRFAVTGAGTVLLGIVALGLAVRAGHDGGSLVYDGYASRAAGVSAAKNADSADGEMRSRDPDGEQEVDED